MRFMCVVSRQKPMLLKEMTRVNELSPQIINGCRCLCIFCVAVEAHGNANAFWEEDALLQVPKKCRVIVVGFLVTVTQRRPE